MAQMTDANRIRLTKAYLSFHDCICFVLAKDNNCECITNDINLRDYCEDEGVSVIWGLDIMLKLIESRTISKTDAIDLSILIALQNVTITQRVLTQFEKKVKAI